MKRSILVFLLTLGMTAAPALGASKADELVGKPAPAFSLPSDQGNTVSLSGFAGKRAVILAFFPKAFTPG